MSEHAEDAIDEGDMQFVDDIISSLKPKKLWIYKWKMDLPDSAVGHEQINSDDIQVIEYSAYELLKSEHDFLIKRVNDRDEKVHFLTELRIKQEGMIEALQAKLDIQINATQILIDTVESYAKGHIGNMLALTKISEYEDALKQFNPVQTGSEG